MESVIIDYCKREVERQQDITGFIGMMTAFDYAYKRKDEPELPNIYDACSLAFLVKRHVSMNLYPVGRRYNFRLTGVHLPDLTPIGAKPDQIDRQMELLFETLETPEFRSVKGWQDEFAKMLLDIHPWEDGNGRVVSILRNWLYKSMTNPTDLPYYYGDR